MTTGNIIRTAVTLAIVVLVWAFNHWTISIAITLLGVNDVLIRHYLKKEQLYRIERQKAEQKLFKRIKKLKQKTQK